MSFPRESSSVSVVSVAFGPIVEGWQEWATTEPSGQAQLSVGVGFLSCCHQLHRRGRRQHQLHGHGRHQGQSRRQNGRLRASMEALALRLVPMLPVPLQGRVVPAAVEVSAAVAAVELGQLVLLAEAVELAELVPLAEAAGEVLEDLGLAWLR